MHVLLTKCYQSCLSGGLSLPFVYCFNNLVASVVLVFLFDQHYRVEMLTASATASSEISVYQKTEILTLASSLSVMF